jgi:hypothetical protein
MEVFRITENVSTVVTFRERVIFLILTFSQFYQKLMERTVDGFFWHYHKLGTGCFLFHNENSLIMVQKARNMYRELLNRDERSPQKCTLFFLLVFTLKMYTIVVLRCIITFIHLLLDKKWHRMIWHKSNNTSHKPEASILDYMILLSYREADAQKIILCSVKKRQNVKDQR